MLSRGAARRKEIAIRLAIGGGLAVLYVLAAGLTFAWVYRYALRTGLIARYSAESVS